MVMNAHIKNMPDRSFDGRHGWMVVRRCVDESKDKAVVELWYYGFFEDEERAHRAAWEIGNGIVLEIGG